MSFDRSDPAAAINASKNPAFTKSYDEKFLLAADHKQRKTMRQPMYKKELSVYSSFEMNPELIKKLSDLKQKIDKMESIQNRELFDVNQRVSKSRDHKLRKGQYSPPVQSLSNTNYPYKYQLNK